jgi:hypothetical protein
VGVEGALVNVGLELAVSVGLGEGDKVGVAASWENASRVIAAAVFRLEKTDSSTSCGSIAMAVATLRSCMAIPETEHSRLIPRRPAANTHNNPRYSASLTSLALFPKHYRTSLPGRPLT